MRKAYRRVGDAEDHAGRDAVRPERDRPAAIVIRHGLTGWSRAGRSEFDELDATEQAVAIDGDLEGHGWVTEQTGDAAMAGDGTWSTFTPERFPLTK